MTEAASAPTAAPQTESSSALSHRQVLTILIGLMMGMFLAALDQTIVSTAIRTIGDDLHGLSIQAWVTTAYLITATISTPLYGKLSDLFGRKPFFLLAISIFVIGSAASAFATSMYMLAAFRALQGLGAGGLFSLALAILADIVAPRERARYQGYFLAVFGTSSVLGPVIGGFFAGRSEIFAIAGWRWVFLVNVPIGLAALFVVSKVLNIPHVKRPHKIDWFGAVALAIGLVPLLIIAEQGREWGWASTRGLICYAVGAVGVALFIFAERRIGDDALLPLRFFKNRVFNLASVGGLLVGMGMFGGIAILPQYLQIVKGVSPTESGLLLLPLTAGIMVGSIISGQLISRTGRYKKFPVIGASLMIIGMALLYRLGVDTAFWEVGIYSAVLGLGLGNILQPITLAVQNAMPPRDIGVATASATFFRQMGGTMGTAVFLSVLFSTVSGKIADAISTASKTPGLRAALQDPTVTSNPANKPLLDAFKGGGLGSGSLNDTSFLNNVDSRLARPILTGFAHSMDLVFVIGAGVMLLALLCMIFMPELELRKGSGMAERDQANAPRPDAAVPADGATAPVEPVEPLAIAAEVDTPATDENRMPAPSAERELPRGLSSIFGTVIEDEALERVISAVLPDPERVVGAVTTADKARAEIQRLQHQLDKWVAEHDTAVAELRGFGLSDEQVGQILGRFPDPTTGGKHGKPLEETDVDVPGSTAGTAEPDRTV